MTTHDIASKLVIALEHTCSGIRHDYNLKELETVFEQVLTGATRGYIDTNQLMLDLKH